jgi:hypothetical protein
MKTKDEEFSKFREFRALIDNRIGKSIEEFQSENGGEYVSKEFDSYCREVGIKI